MGRTPRPGGGGIAGGLPVSSVEGGLRAISCNLGENLKSSPPVPEMGSFERLARHSVDNLIRPTFRSGSSDSQEAAYRLLLAAASDCTAVGRVLSSASRVSDSIIADLARLHASRGSTSCIERLISSVVDVSNRVRLWGDVILLLAGRTPRRSLVALAESAEVSARSGLSSTDGVLVAGQLTCRLAAVHSISSKDVGDQSEFMAIARRILVGAIQSGGWRDVLLGIMRVQRGALDDVSESLTAPFGQD
jgi:hypothetical protein